MESAGAEGPQEYEIRMAVPTVSELKAGSGATVPIEISDPSRPGMAGVRIDQSPGFQSAEDRDVERARERRKTGFEETESVASCDSSRKRICAHC